MLWSLLFFKSVLLKTNLFPKPCADHVSANQYVLLLEMFSQTMLMKLYLLGNLPFFKSHVIVLWLEMTLLVPFYLKTHVVGEGLG